MTNCNLERFLFETYAIIQTAAEGSVELNNCHFRNIISANLDNAAAIVMVNAD
jgi:hypothetical protein